MVDEPMSQTDDAVRATRHWEAREERAEVEAAIAAWERLLDERDDDAEVRVALARALAWLADGHLAFERDGAAQIGPLHERGRVHAERALALAHPDLAACLDDGGELADRLDLIDRRALPALYWYAVNRRGQAAAQGFWAIAAQSPQLNRIWQRCLGLDESYHHGAAHAWLALFHTRAPASGGGDLAKAAAHFARAMQIAPGYLATRVLWAEYYATKRKDAAAFQRELEYVLAQPDDILPDVIAENRLEKRRAQALVTASLAKASTCGKAAAKAAKEKAMPKKKGKPSRRP